MRVLLVEDDPQIGEAVRVGLGRLGITIDWVRDGELGLQCARSEPFDAVVLDLGLPLKDGLEVLKSVRQQKINLPVLVLTARDAVPERIKGLDLGADDYVVKPVDLFELGARLRSLVRRAHGHTQDLLTCADLQINLAARSVTLAGQPVALSLREFDLLHVLMLNAQRVLSREQLEQQLYSWGYEVESNAVEVHIHHLRKKLQADLIQTVRGVGYMLMPPKTSPESA